MRVEIIYLLFIVLLSGCLQELTKTTYQEKAPLYHGELTLEPGEIKGICINTPANLVGYELSGGKLSAFSMLDLQEMRILRRTSPAGGGSGGRTGFTGNGRTCYIMDNRGSKEQVYIRLNIFTLGSKTPLEQQTLTPVVGNFTLVEETIELLPGGRYSVCFNASISGKDYLEISLKPLEGESPYWITRLQYEVLYEGKHAHLLENLTEKDIRVLYRRDLGGREIPEKPVLVIGETRENSDERCLNFESHSDSRSVLYFSVTKHIRERK
jgi:hypothetical protein